MQASASPALMCNPPQEVFQQMKRSLLVLSVVALFLVVACASTTATPGVTGVVTAKTGNSITITPAGGTAQTINVSGAHVFWGNGLEAGRADLAVGQPVSVYLANGSTTNANRVVINL